MEKLRNIDLKSEPHSTDIFESHRIINTIPESDFNAVTELAAQLCKSPISLITIVNGERQIFKSKYGLERNDTPLEHSFCKYIINGSGEPLIVKDAREDARFKNNSLVLGAPGIVSYAGFPIKNSGGTIIASICIIDREARDFTKSELSGLETLSHQLSNTIELRKYKEELEQKNHKFQEVIESTGSGLWELYIGDNTLKVNSIWLSMIGLDFDSLAGLNLNDWLRWVHPDDLPELERQLEGCVQGSISTIDLKYRLLHKNNFWIWVYCKGKRIDSMNGSSVKISGVQLDVLEKELTKEKLSSISDNIPGSMFRYTIYVDGSDSLTHVSKGFLNLWGISAEEATKDNSLVWKLIHEEDVGNVTSSIEQSAKTMTLWKAEWRINHTDGTLKWHRGVGKPVKNPDGSIYWDSLIFDITEEKRHLELLSERNNFIEAILGNLPLGIVVHDLKSGVATAVNDKFCQIYGWPADEISEMDAFFNKVYPEKAYRDEIRGRVQSDIESGEDERMQWNGIKVTTKNRETRYVDSKNILLKDLGIMVSTVIDRTDDYENKMTIKSNNERYKYATLATSDTIWDLDLKKEHLYWGENYKLNFGYRPDNDVSKNYGQWQEQLHPEDKNEVLKSLNESLSGTHTSWSAEYRFKKADGDYLTVLDKGFIIRDAKGEAIRMVGAIQDISVQREKEQQLHIFKTVLEKSADPIIITKAEPLYEPYGPEIVYVNEAFTKSTGYALEEAIGKTPRILQGPKTDKKVLKKMGADLRAWKKVDEDILNYTKSGKEFWVNLSIAPVANEAGWYTHWISIQKDITEKKNREILHGFLNKLSHVFNEQLNHHDTLERIAALFFEDLGAQMVEFWSMNQNKNSLKMVANHYAKESYSDIKDFGRDNVIPLGSDLAGEVLTNSEPYIWENTDTDVEFGRYDWASANGFKMVYGAPLISKESKGALILAFEQSKEQLISLGCLPEIINYLIQELARKKLEEDLNQLIQFSPGYICVLDETHTLKEVNPIFAKEMGNGCIGTNFLDIIHTDDKTIMEDALKTSVQDQQHATIETRCITNRNRVFWVSWTITMVEDDGVVYCMGSDVTEKRRLEELLEKASNLAKIGSWEYDVVKNELFWSKITKKIHQVPLEFDPEIATAINFYKKGWHRSKISELVELSVKDGISFTEELVITTAEGEDKWIKVIGVPEVSNGEVVKISGSIQDISERKTHENSLVDLNKRLKFKAKQLQISNEELEQFAFVASHDLQEPLRMITSFLTLLEKRYEKALDEKGIQYIHFAVDGALRMRKIILELLEFSRVGSLNESPKEVDLNPLLNEISILYKKQIREKKAELVYKDLPMVRSFETSLRQIFSNLISNSLKYSKEGIPPKISIYHKDMGDFWEFTVTDNGIGIDPQYFDKIFIIFQRLHNRDEYSGIGMGLATTKKIIETNGGSIRVESTTDQGSTFIFTLKKIKK